MNDKDLKEYIKEIYAASVWNVPSVNDEPETQLSRWSIVQTIDRGEKKIKLVGNHMRLHEGRVSSTILSFDKKTMTAITRSGRRYILVGPPGHDPNGWHVLNQCFWDRKIKDITQEFLEIDNE